jgi:hypothetical protein
MCDCQDKIIRSSIMRLLEHTRLHVLLSMKAPAKEVREERGAAAQEEQEQANIALISVY